MNSTGNFTPDYIRHTYTVTSELKSYTVYELLTSEGNAKLLTEILRIEKFQGKSNASNINDYLRLRNCSNWSKSEQVTGLRPTTKEGLFYGDWRKPNESDTPKKTLLLFLFSTDRKTLFIDVYRGFYPINPVLLQNIINTY
jgi:hypothetical protein